MVKPFTNFMRWRRVYNIWSAAWISEVILALLPLGDPPRVSGWQVGFFKTGLGSRDIVGNAAV